MSFVLPKPLGSTFRQRSEQTRPGQNRPDQNRTDQKRTKQSSLPSYLHEPQTPQRQLSITSLQSPRHRHHEVPHRQHRPLYPPLIQLRAGRPRPSAGLGRTGRERLQRRIYLPQRLVPDLQLCGVGLVQHRTSELDEMLSEADIQYVAKGP
jgi:hypothetical protein